MDLLIIILDHTSQVIKQRYVCRLSLNNERPMRLKMRICSKQIELIDLEDNKKIAESMFTFRIPSIIFKHAEHAQIYFHI